MSTPLQVLGELVEYAASHGEEIGKVVTDIVDGFIAKRPELITPDHVAAPPPRGDTAIDWTIDDKIDAGEL